MTIKRDRPVRIVKGPIKAKPTTPRDAGPPSWIIPFIAFILGFLLATGIAHSAVTKEIEAPHCWALFINDHRETKLPAYTWHGACERWRLAAIAATCEREKENSERQAECYDKAPQGAECRPVACRQVGKQGT